MRSDLACRWDLEWRQAPCGLPEGPVELWLAVASDEGAVMGAGPMTETPSWCWKDGRPAISYGPVRILIQRRGRYARGLIVAVSRESGAWAPVCPIGLSGGKRRELRAGDEMTMVDGVLALYPELHSPAFPAGR